MRAHCSIHCRSTCGLLHAGNRGVARVATASRLGVRCNAGESQPDSPPSDAPEAGRRMRRVRLFKEGQEPEQPQRRRPSSDASGGAVEQQPLVPVSEEFKRAFESLAGPSSSSKPGRRRPAAAPDAEGSGSRQQEQPWEAAEPDTDNDRQPRRSQQSSRSSIADERGSASSSRGRSSRSAASSSSSSGGGRSWEGRGRRSDEDYDSRGRFNSREDYDSSSGSSRQRPSSRRLTPDEQQQRERWEQEAQDRQAEAERAERARLIRKARSEAIPTAPKGSQDPVIFQALTRQWDPKASQEEHRGARASARKVARIGLEDRNKKIKNLRRNVLQQAGLKKGFPGTKPLLTEDEAEAARVAARAQQQLQQAAAISIPKSREQLYQEGAGVKRSFARAEALPEGEWERLKRQYKAAKTVIKIGRRGATPALVNGIQAAWRGSEVVKLAIHDERSARNANLPRLNLLLQELEDRTGGVLVEQAGSSIWLYRGVDWKPKPVPPPYKPPAEEDRFVQEYSPRGRWTDIGGITCYIIDGTSSSSDDGSSEDGSSEADSSKGSSISSSAETLLLFLPDQFPMAEAQLQMQIADKAASQLRALVVMADLLGPPPGSPQGNIATNGLAEGNKAGGYWVSRHWPLVKGRKLEYFDWYKTGPGSWPHQKPRLLALLAALQQQGAYSRQASAAVAAAAAAAGCGGFSWSNDSSGGRPLGVLGLGWGSYIGLRAAGDEEAVQEGVVAVACVSPVTCAFDADIAKQLRIPVALLPAKYDPMEQVQNIVDLLGRPYSQRCLFKRFGKVKPGWAHWLPQWVDNRAMWQAAEQLLLATGFLRRELTGRDDSPALQVALEEQREQKESLQLRAQQKFNPGPMQQQVEQEEEQQQQEQEEQQQEQEEQQQEQEEQQQEQEEQQQEQEEQQEPAVVTNAAAEGSEGHQE